MLMQFVEFILPPLIAILELMGIFVVAVSAAIAFWRYLKGLLFHAQGDVKFALANALPPAWNSNGGGNPQNGAGTGDERTHGTGRRHPIAGTALISHPF